MAGFEDFGLDERIVKAVREMGYTKPTPIQEKCINVVLSGADCVAQSSTGSGKTAAFGLPILQKIKKGEGLQFVVLTPTRELCIQVKDSLVQFSKHLNLTIAAIFGGAPMPKQIELLQVCEVMVGTPGRVIDHLKRGTINFSRVRFLVLDEADRMLDMGFIDDVMKITSRIPTDRQTMLFSATIPDEIRHVIRKHLKEPVFIKTETYVDKSHLHQTYYSLRQEEKFSLLVHLLKTKSKGFALVFCATRRKVDALTRNLILQGVEAVGIHGGMLQNKRLKAIDRLKRSTIHVLVATDVAARGLDIRNITHIYNYDVPKTSDEYIHRIGRTARAGAEGDAITFVAQQDADNFKAVLSDRSLEIKEVAKPDHERLPYKGKGGGDNRRGRPEGISRTGKQKSDFSNTHPRVHTHSTDKHHSERGANSTHTSERGAAEQRGGQPERRDFPAAEQRVIPEGQRYSGLQAQTHPNHQAQPAYNRPIQHQGSQPLAHQPERQEHNAPRAQPAGGQRYKPVLNMVAHHKSAVGQEERRGTHPYTTGRMNRKQRRNAHRNNQQRHISN